MMKLENRGSGIALRCDEGGTIRSVVHDKLGLTDRCEPGRPFIAVVDDGSLEKARYFLNAVREDGAAFDWEMNVPLTEQIATLHFAGTWVDGDLLIIGAKSRNEVVELYEELMRIQNEQMNTLRAVVKDQMMLSQTATERDTNVYEELTRLNNELANAQRELAQRNARLERMETELQRYANHLEDLVAEKIRELEMERAKVIQSGKLAALGEMATGVAHELNQPLAAMLFEADYFAALAEKAEERGQDAISLGTEELREIGEDLAQDVARCRRIIDHLRDFGRISDKDTILTDLNQPIQDSFILVGARLRERNVRVELDLADDLPPIMAGPHRLEQVFLNLISNAEHAMDTMEERVRAGKINRPRYQKTLSISTYVEGDTLFARVQDNGPGIPPSAQEHIFEPFFTTKPMGQGTGLGLSISHNIVTEFDGQITYETAQNQGTTFILSFPVADEENSLA
jgi:C4-dicarboxylate-specific signal transduction histidine kinase